MKWTALPIAGLLALMMAVPSLAQDDTKEEARKVLLKEKLTKDLKITEGSDAVTTQEVALENGMVVQGSTETESEISVMEFLEVSEDGTVTKYRKRWTYSEKETVASQMGQEGEPVKETGKHKDASILFTWNAEKKAWEGKVEKGDKEADEVKKELAKKNPLANPMLPGREVKLGEEWKGEEEAMKDFFGQNEGLKLSKIESTFKAEEILEEEGVEYLRVSFNLDFTGELQDESIGKPEVKFTNKGSYYFNIKESRIEAVEMETTGGFSASVEDPNMGKMNLTVSIEGSREMAIAHGKVGDKDILPGADDEDSEDEGGMDG